jgi:hypothetical protein
LQVEQFYSAYLHRTGSVQEYAAWANALASGALSETQVVELMLTSPEYLAAHPSNQDYVTGLYNDVLLRNGHYSATDVAAWVGELNTGALSRSAVAAAFVNSGEALANGITYNYEGYLRRRESAAELQGWLTALAANPTNSTAVAALFLSSPEYLNLAGNV